MTTQLIYPSTPQAFFKDAFQNKISIHQSTKEKEQTEIETYPTHYQIIENQTYRGPPCSLYKY